MNDLNTFFQQLAAWEGKPPTPVAAAWESFDAKDVASELDRAVTACGFESVWTLVPADISPSATGNRVEKFFAKRMNRHLGRFKIRPCPGNGYPDKKLVRLADGDALALELKATTEFDERDGNRMVLTSGSAKLRKHFKLPVRHLLLTACYRQQGRRVYIEAIRMDFLQPGTLVNVRFEASTSKRLLAKSSETCIWIKVKGKDNARKSPSPNSPPQPPDRSEREPRQ
jgi:hypothetical protein